MRGRRFCKGALIEIDGRKLLLSRKSGDDIWQLEDVASGRYLEKSDRELREDYVSGRLIFADGNIKSKQSDVSDMARPLPESDPDKFEAAKLRRTYVKSIDRLPGTRNVIGPVIEETWERLGRPGKPPDCSTVLRWRRRFMDSGNDIASLVESSAKKGNRSARFPDEVIRIARAAIDRKYMTLERASIQETLDAAKIEIRAENRLLASAATLPMPTRRLVKRLIDEIPAFDRHAARYGRDSANNAFRAVTGFRVIGAPLERAEIDHTPLDLLVIDDDSGMPIGRPYLTTCIDAYSRCVLGCVVSFEPPSFLTVAQCLKHALLPKTGLRAEQSTLRNDWEAHGIPEELVVDNGAEFHSVSLEKACLELGTEIHYAPRRNGAFKGIIERFQKTMNDSVAHGSPGTTFSNIFEKEDYNPAKHAVIGFRRLKEILTIWIVDVYHQRPHRSLASSPASVWSSAIAPEDIPVPPSGETLDVLLGRVESGRRLSHKGIELDGLFYNSSELTALRRRLGSVLNVDLRVNDSDLGRIAVLVPGENSFVFAHALNSAYASGLSRWQHKVCRRFARMQSLPENPDSWLDAKAEIARLISEEFLAKKTRGNKRAARFAMSSTSTSMPPLYKDLSLPTDEAPPGDSIAGDHRPTTPRKMFAPITSIRSTRSAPADNSEANND